MVAKRTTTKAQRVKRTRKQARQKDPVQIPKPMSPAASVLAPAPAPAPAPHQHQAQLKPFELPRDVKRLKLDPGQGDLYIGEWKSRASGEIVDWNATIEPWISRVNPSDRFVSQISRIYDEYGITTGSWEYLKDRFERSKICRGEQIGIVAAQSLSERFTQSCLNTFHFAGLKKSAVIGMGRIMELLRASKKISVPAIGPLPNASKFIERSVGDFISGPVSIDWCSETYGGSYVISIPTQHIDIMRNALTPVLKRWIGDKCKAKRRGPISDAAKAASTKMHVSGKSWIEKLARLEGQNSFIVQVRSEACHSKESASKCVNDLIYKTMRFGKGMRVRDYITEFECLDDRDGSNWTFKAKCLADVLELELIMDAIADNCMNVSSVVMEDESDQYELINAPIGSTIQPIADITKAVVQVLYEEDEEILKIFIDGSNTSRASCESFLRRKVFTRIASGLSGAIETEDLEDGSGMCSVMFSPVAGKVPCRLCDVAEIVLESFCGNDEQFDRVMNKLISTDTQFVVQSLGIEAARAYLVKEMARVLSAEGIDVAPKHIELIIDNMTVDGDVSPNTFYGMDATSAPLLSITFERAFQTFRVVAENGGSDDLKDPSSCVMMGKLPRMGTNFRLGMIDVRKEVTVQQHQNFDKQLDLPDDYIPVPDSPRPLAQHFEQIIEPTFW